MLKCGRSENTGRRGVDARRGGVGEWGEREGGTLGRGISDYRGDGEGYAKGVGHVGGKGGWGGRVVKKRGMWGGGGKGLGGGEGGGHTKSVLGGMGRGGMGKGGGSNDGV